jgi:hypothetical protein
MCGRVRVCIEIEQSPRTAAAVAVSLLFAARARPLARCAFSPPPPNKIPTKDICLRIQLFVRLVDLQSVMLS